MRALGSSVLAFEVIISFLFIPAALQESSVNTNLIIGISLSQITVSILAMGFMGKKSGIYLGHLAQILLVASGLVVSWMFVLGLIFLGLWIMAIRIGRRTDELKASKKVS